MSQLTLTITRVLQVVNSNSLNEEKKKALIESYIRGYAASAINFVLDIETTASVGKEREERINNLTKQYGIQESLMGEFY